MFKFNFEVENGEEFKENKKILNKNDNQTENAKRIKTSSEAQETKPVYGSLNFDQVESKSTCDLKSKRESIIFKKMNLSPWSHGSEIFIDYVDSYKINIEEKETLAEINKTHDLVPGKYEGGLKVWELSLDLARFIYNINLIKLDELKKQISNEDIISNFKSFQTFFNRYLENKENESSRTVLRILELGCGHALPALSVCTYLDEMMTKSGAEHDIEVALYLQDFNQEIIEEITYENVKKFLGTLNRNSKLKLSIQFVYGDWRDLYEQDVLPADYFNLILTSETIYNSENYKYLLDLFRKCMVKESNEGLVLLSAKTYYFGCGGNLHDFLQMTKSDAYKFKASENLLFNEDVYTTDKSGETTAQNDSVFKYNSSYLNAAHSAVGKEIIKMEFNF